VISLWVLKCPLSYQSEVLHCELWTVNCDRYAIYIAFYLTEYLVHRPPLWCEYISHKLILLREDTAEPRSPIMTTDSGHTLSEVPESYCEPIWVQMSHYHERISIALRISPVPIPEVYVWVVVCQHHLDGETFYSQNAGTILLNGNLKRGHFASKLVSEGILAMSLECYPNTS